MSFLSSMMDCQAGESVAPLMGFCGMDPEACNREEHGTEQPDGIVHLREISKSLPGEYLSSASEHSHFSPIEMQKSGSDVFLCEFVANPPFTQDRVTLLDPSIVRETPHNPIGHLEFKGNGTLLSPIPVRRYSDLSSCHESPKRMARKSKVPKILEVETVKDDDCQLPSDNTTVANDPLGERSTSSLNVLQSLVPEASDKVQTLPELTMTQPETMDVCSAQENLVPAAISEPPKFTINSPHLEKIEIGGGFLFKAIQAFTTSVKVPPPPMMEASGESVTPSTEHIPATVPSDSSQEQLPIDQDPADDSKISGGFLLQSILELSANESQQPVALQEQVSILAANESVSEKENAPPPLVEVLPAPAPKDSDEVSEEKEDDKPAMEPSIADQHDWNVAVPDGNKDGHRKFRDLTSAKKQLDVSSLNFSERLRGAANLRKLEVVRSRDSLAAKEREHILSIEAAKQQKANSERKAPREAPPPRRAASMQSTTNDLYRPFKALPLPKAAKGDVGIIGVPKVDKHRATTPVSPSLGTRRRDSSMKAPHCEQPDVDAAETESETQTTQARKIPKKSATATAANNRRAVSLMLQQRSTAVKAGGPKRECEMSRPNAVRHAAPNPQCPPSAKRAFASGPSSRLLAGSEASRAKEQARLELLRREEEEAKARAQFKARPLPKYISSASSESPVLRGLSYLASPAGKKDELTTPPKNNTSGYEPHSTLRAKKRAEFDTKRAANEEERFKEERKASLLLVQSKRRELNKLRQEIRRASVL